MLQPKRTKHRKVQKGRIKGLAQRGNQLTFGSFGIKALEPFWMSQQQIEALRVIFKRSMRGLVSVWIRVFPDKPITKKPAEVRMGKGKGSPEYWVAVVKPGRILFEIDGVSHEIAEKAMRLASLKLGVRTKMVVRRDLGDISQ
jgi:large subunit ribosomal protein L16